MRRLEFLRRLGLGFVAAPVVVEALGPICGFCDDTGLVRRGPQRWGEPCERCTHYHTHHPDGALNTGSGPLEDGWYRATLDCATGESQGYYWNGEWVPTNDVTLAAMGADFEFWVGETFYRRSRYALPPGDLHIRAEVSS